MTPQGSREPASRVYRDLPDMVGDAILEPCSFPGHPQLGHVRREPEIVQQVLIGVEDKASGKFQEHSSATVKMELCVDNWSGTFNIFPEEKYTIGDEQSSKYSIETGDLASSAVTYFLCCICETYFSDKIKFAQHEAQGHTNSSPNKHKICDMTVNTLQNKVVSENQNMGSFQLCEVCESVFISEEAFSCHKVEAHSPSVAPEGCSKRLTAKLELSKPLQLSNHRHNCIRETCELCIETKTTVTSLIECQDSEVTNIKKERTTEDNPSDSLSMLCGESCEHCYQLFLDKVQLKSHILTHHPEELFICQYCKKKFFWKNNLARHINRSHAKEQEYGCDLCDLVFSRKCHLDVHRKTHSRKTNCNWCGKSFSHDYLNIHIQTHIQEHPYMCEFCGKTFAVRGYLLDHIICHKAERSLECNFCGKMFVSKNRLKRHIRGHMGIRLFKCRHCCKSFVHSNSLNNHIRAHTGERSFMCHICQLTFLQNSQLKSHIRTHTGERKFVCEHCGWMYTRKYHLLNHIVRKHL